MRPEHKGHMQIWIMYRMYTCIKALLFGEDFALDPVTKSLRLALMLFSGGHINVDIQSFSQVILLQ